MCTVLAWHEWRCPFGARAAAAPFCLSDIHCIACRVLGCDMFSPTCHLCHVLLWEPRPWPGCRGLQPEPNGCCRHHPAPHDLWWHICPSAAVACILEDWSSRDLQLSPACADRPPTEGYCNGERQVSCVLCLTCGGVLPGPIWRAVRRPLRPGVCVVAAATQLVDLGHIRLECLLLTAGASPAASVVQGSPPPG